MRERIRQLIDSTRQRIHTRWRAANLRNGLAILLLTIVAVAAPNLVSTADAAQVAPTHATLDELRCSSIAYNNGGSTWGQLSKCYSKTPWPASWQGTRRTITGAVGTELAGSIPAVNASMQSTGGCSMATAGITREAWFGPFVGVPLFGDLPAQSVVIRTDCASGTYWNNMSMSAHAAVSVARSWLSPLTTAYSVTATADTVDNARSINYGGVLWFGIVGSYSLALSTITWPADWYAGGAQYTTVSPFCGAVVTSTTGATAEIVNGQSVVFSIAWTSGTTDSVQVRWPGATTYTTIYTAGTIGNPATFNATVVIPVAARDTLWRMTDVLMKCRNTLTGITHYLGFDQAVAAIGDGRQRPCMLPRVYWPRWETVAAGEVVTFHISYSGLTPTGMASTIAVSYMTYDESVGFSRPLMLSGPYTAVNLSMPLGTNTDFNVTTGYAGTMRQVIFKCTDAVGTIYQAGPWAANVRYMPVAGSYLGPNEEPPRPTVGDCISAGGGIGFNPSSWVPGLVKMGSCVMEAMFVPSHETINTTLSSAQSFGDKAPFAYGVRGYVIFKDTFTGTSTAVTAHQSDCLTLIDRLPTGQSLSASSVCLADAAPSASGFRVILGYLMWIGGGWMFFRISRKVVMA